MERQAGRTVRRIGGIILTVLASVLLVFALVLVGITASARAKGRTPEIFGYSFHVVVSPSMTPTIAVGEMVVARTAEFDSIRIGSADSDAPGDVIVFRSVDDTSSVYGYNVVHRAVEVAADGGIVTKGDANDFADMNDSGELVTVTADNFVGVVVSHSAALGAVALFLSNPMNWMFLVVFAVMAVAIYYIVRTIVRQVRHLNDETPPQTDGPDRDAMRAEIEAELRAQGLIPEDSAGGGQAASSADSTAVSHSAAEEEAASTK